MSEVCSGEQTFVQLRTGFTLFFYKRIVFILGGPRIKQAERWRKVVPQNLFKPLLGESGPKRGAAFGEEFIYIEILNWGGDGGVEWLHK